MVEIFGLAQTNQVKVQSQVYEQIEQMQNEMYVARGLLAEVSSSASNLQATIEGTSTRMAQQIATISGMTEKVFRWGWLLLVVAFLLHQSRPLSISTPLGMSALLLGRSSSLSFFALSGRSISQLSWVPLQFSLSLLSKPPLEF